MIATYLLIWLGHKAHFEETRHINAVYCEASCSTALVCLSAFQSLDASSFVPAVPSSLYITVYIISIYLRDQPEPVNKLAG